jgi:site-specific DNA recombinase
VRVGIYVRLSSDPDGTSTAIARQLEDCERLASSKGWQVTATYRDSDLSAFKRNVNRPEFERMLTDASQGAIDAILVWRTDRLARQPRDLERFVDACEKQTVTLASVTEPLDLRTNSGLFILRQLVNFANYESAVKSERVRRKHVELASGGKHHGGGCRAFGLTSDRKAIIPEEAELVREAVSGLLGGRSLHGIVVEWNKAGVRTPRDRAWSVGSFRQMIESPHLYGQRVHLGVVVAEARWPAIIPKETGLRLQALLADPSRRRAGRPAEYLLSGGLLVCGLCQGNMVGHVHRGQRRYICSKVPHRPESGGLAIVADPLEQLVVSAVMNALDGPDLWAALSSHKNEDQSALLASLEADEADLEQLGRDLAEHRLTRPQVYAATTVIRQRMDDTRRKLVRPLSNLPEIRDIASSWEVLNVDRKRAVLSAILSAVIVRRARPGASRLEPSRVELVWRA